MTRRVVPSEITPEAPGGTGINEGRIPTISSFAALATPITRKPSAAFPARTLHVFLFTMARDFMKVVYISTSFVERGLTSVGSADRSP